MDGDIWPTDDVLAAYKTAYAVNDVKPVPPFATPTVPSPMVLPVLVIGAVTAILPDEDVCTHTSDVEPTVIVPVVFITHEVEPHVVPPLTNVDAPVSM